MSMSHCVLHNIKNTEKSNRRFWHVRTKNVLKLQRLRSSWDLERMEFPVLHIWWQNSTEESHHLLPPRFLWPLGKVMAAPSAFAKSHRKNTAAEGQVNYSSLIYRPAWNYWNQGKASKPLRCFEGAWGKWPWSTGFGRGWQKNQRESEWVRHKIQGSRKHYWVTKLLMSYYY